MLQSFIVVAA